MAERVWDRFLTDRDEARLAARTRRAKGFGDWPAVLCMDFYRFVVCDRPRPLMKEIEEWSGTCKLEAWRRSVSSTPQVC